MKALEHQWRGFVWSVSALLLFPLWMWLVFTKQRDVDGHLCCDTLIQWWIEGLWRKCQPESYAKLMARGRSS